jgi:hypothetical protein
MAKKSWTFELDNEQHIVKIDHGYFSGKKVIYLDGEVLEESRKIIDTDSEHTFQIGDHTCRIVVESNWVKFNYDLIVDGRSIESGEAFRRRPPLPAWSWIFIAACVAIPVVTLGGLIPTLIGVGGAFFITIIGRGERLSTTVRVALSTAITGLCWIIFVGLVWGSVWIQGT